MLIITPIFTRSLVLNARHVVESSFCRNCSKSSSGVLTTGAGQHRDPPTTNRSSNGHKSLADRFSWLISDTEARESVIDGLKNIYKRKLLPLENRYLFHEFHSPPLQEADFDSKPLVLLIGQYSTGKSSMIR